MANFSIGETVICSVEVKNANGNFVNPSDDTKHMKITIIDKNGKKKTDDVIMDNDSTGKYHYDFQTAGCIDGEYIVYYKAVDGTRINIEKETFNLE